MSCTVTVDTDGIDSGVHPFPEAPGGRVFGSIRLTAACDEERAQPQLDLDEADTGLFAALVNWFGVAEVYRRPLVYDEDREKRGFVVIEDVWRVDVATLGLMINVTTDTDGPQSFPLRFLCRCRPGATWQTGAVSVPFSI